MTAIHRLQLSLEMRKHAFANTMEAPSMGSFEPSGGAKFMDRASSFGKGLGNFAWDMTLGGVVDNAAEMGQHAAQGNFGKSLWSGAKAVGNVGFALAGGGLAKGGLKLLGKGISGAGKMLAGRGVAGAANATPGLAGMAGKGFLGKGIGALGGAMRQTGLKTQGAGNWMGNMATKATNSLSNTGNLGAVAGAGTAATMSKLPMGVGKAYGAVDKGINKIPGIGGFASKQMPMMAPGMALGGVGAGASKLNNWLESPSHVGGSPQQTGQFMDQARGHLGGGHNFMDSGFNPGFG